MSSARIERESTSRPACASSAPGSALAPLRGSERRVLQTQCIAPLRGSGRSCDARTRAGTLRGSPRPSDAGRSRYRSTAWSHGRRVVEHKSPPTPASLAGIFYTMTSVPEIGQLTAAAAARGRCSSCPSKKRDASAVPPCARRAVSRSAHLKPSKLRRRDAQHPALAALAEPAIVTRCAPMQRLGIRPAPARVLASHPACT